MANTPCGAEVIAPRNVSAMVSGSFQIFLRWFKPLPDSYDFSVKCHPHDSANGEQAIQKHTAYGPIFAFQASDLVDKTLYDFTIQHVCKDGASPSSPEVTSSATTLDSSTFINLGGVLNRLIVFQVKYL